MPKGIPKDAVLDPLTGRYMRKKTEAPTPVRQEIKNMAGGTPEEIKEALPESTVVPMGVTVEEPQKRKRRTKAEMEAEQNTDPLMQDERYRKAVSGMVGFGGSRFIKTPFKVASVALERPDMALQSEEEQRVDDYFYVVSKRSNLDPNRGWFIALYGVVMLLELIIGRVWMYNQQSFANAALEFFGIKFGEDKEKKEEKVQ